MDVFGAEVCLFLFAALFSFSFYKVGYRRWQVFLQGERCSDDIGTGYLLWGCGVGTLLAFISKSRDIPRIM